MMRELQIFLVQLVFQGTSLHLLDCRNQNSVEFHIALAGEWKLNGGFLISAVKNSSIYVQQHCHCIQQQ